MLDIPTRVAIHLTHRLGALIATLTLCWAALTAMLRPAAANMTLCGAAVLGALGLQLTVGISMVLEGFPLSLATAHTAGAALLLLAVLALLRTLQVRAHHQSF